MALVIKDRVRQTSTTAGTGTITLSGSVTGYQDFTVIGTGNTTYYTIADQSGSNWEVGLGTWTSPNQLSRDTVYESSNGNALVNFGANIKDVFVTLPAEGFASPPAIGGTTPNTITGTTVTAKTEIDLPAVVNTGITNGRLYMTDGGDGYDYLNIDTWDGSASYKVNFPGGLGQVVGNIDITGYVAVPQIYVTGTGTAAGNISIRDSSNVAYISLTVPTLSVSYTLTLPTTAGSANQVLKTDGSGNLDWVTQGVQGTSPVTVTAATHTVAATTQWLIANRAGTVTLTLPTASSNAGRSLNVKTITANTVVSNASNVVPLAGGAAGTAILAATAGKFATLVSDGTNWIIIAAG